MARKYEQTRRATQREQTRRRIVEAAVALHEAVGGAAATVTAIAERAGVGRLTVYRHFPDERALLTACTSHYFAANPPPDSAAWEGIAEPEARLRTALGEVYAFYRRTEGMLARAEQEAPTNPVLAELLVPFAALRDRMRDLLAAGWGEPGEPDPLVVAAVGHALAFATWASLVRQQGLDDAQAVELMLKLVGCASSRHRHRPATLAGSAGA